MNLNLTNCIQLSDFLILTFQQITGGAMIKNVGLHDRNFRFIVGGIVIILGIVFQSWWGLVGLIPLATGFMRSCPIYMPFKLSTDKKEAEAK